MKYKMRRFVNTAIDDAAFLRREMRSCMSSEDDLTYICAAMVRVLAPIIVFLLLASIATAMF